MLKPQRSMIQTAGLSKVPSMQRAARDPAPPKDPESLFRLVQLGGVGQLAGLAPPGLLRDPDLHLRMLVWRVIGILTAELTPKLAEHLGVTQRTCQTSLDVARYGPSDS